MPAPGTEQMPIQTPCIKVCEIHPGSGLCTGCGRTLQEIGRWGAMSDAERAAIMAGLPGRMDRAGLAAPVGAR
jgi:predicted Fe-S protein YdhL (DUF1289 family)